MGRARPIQAIPDGCSRSSRKVSASVAGEETRTPSRYRAAWTMLGGSAPSGAGGSASGAGAWGGAEGGVRARRQADFLEPLAAELFAAGRARRSDIVAASRSRVEPMSA